MPVWARKAYCTCKLTCWWTSCYRSQALQGPALQIHILRCCTWPGTRWVPGGDAAIRTERPLSRQWSSSCTKAEGRWISTQLAHVFLLFRLGLNGTLVFYHRKEKFSALRTASVVRLNPLWTPFTFFFLEKSWEACHTCFLSINATSYVKLGSHKEPLPMDQTNSHPLESSTGCPAMHSHTLCLYP